MQQRDANPLAPVVAIALPAAVIVAEHYAPWRRWFRGLHPIAAYTLGTLAILIPATLASQPRKHRRVVGMFWLAAGSAGAATCAAWGIDWAGEKLARMADEVDRHLYGAGE